MKNRWSLKGQNRGASLIAVLAAITFASVIGIVISQITITNIQMKQMEQQGKTNFYSAEAVLDDLAAGLNTKAAGAMQEAYTDMLSQYRTVTESGGNVQQTFSRLYMDNLIALFQAAPEGSNNPHQKKASDADGTEKVVYEIGYYSVHNIKKSFSTKAVPDGADPADPPAPGVEENYLYEDCLMTAPAAGMADSASYYRADYEAGTFVLEGIVITAKDEQTGYETTISTDIVFNTPELNFENNNMVKDFMRYSLIADHSININSSNVTVDGNAYAGENGIFSSSSGNGTFKGNIVVTRGDIYVTSGTRLTVGNDSLTSRIYAENVKTVSSGSVGDASTLNLQGNCYISDDLEMDGKNSNVNLKGYYYGYNFQKNYSALSTDIGSQYSSAIMINGRNARLNMEELKYLFLAGRTYIARNGGTADVPLGESLSVRSNQMAYNVPDVFLNVVDPSNVVFQDESGAAVSNYMKVDNIYDYVSASNPVTAYNYTASFGTDTVYYLNFISEQKGNDFFAEYYENNKDQINSYAENYVANDALQISPDMIYTLKGDLMKRVGSDLTEERVVITNNYWNPDGAFYERASSMGVTYKSLQTYLEESHTGVTPSTIRFENDNDKTLDRLLYNLIDVPRMKTYLNGEPGREKKIDCSRDGETYAVVLIDNEGAGAYQVPTSMKGGLVVATGDVEVFTGLEDANREFEGLIIAGGEIRFATNASVKSNEALVSQLFAEDVRGENSDFAFLFKGYDLSGESSMGEVAIDKYMTYDNWSKTVE